MYLRTRFFDTSVLVLKGIIMIIILHPLFCNKTTHKTKILSLNGLCTFFNVMRASYNIKNGALALLSDVRMRPEMIFIIWKKKLKNYAKKKNILIFNIISRKSFLLQSKCNFLLIFVICTVPVNYSTIDKKPNFSYSNIFMTAPNFWKKYPFTSKKKCQKEALKGPGGIGGATRPKIFIERPQHGSI